jgi:hypothetical protein
MRGQPLAHRLGDETAAARRPKSALANQYFWTMGYRVAHASAAGDPTRLAQAFFA